MEMYGSLWKTRDQSIDKYVSDGQSGPKSQTEAEQEDGIGRKELVSRAVRDITPLLTSIRRRHNRPQQRSIHVRS